MSKKLLIRPNPFPDESIYSYFIRLTDLNGYETPNNIISVLNKKNHPHIYNQISPSSSFVNSANRFMSELSEFTLKDINSLYDLVQFTIDYQYVELFSSQVAKSLVRPNIRKYCPECLRDKPYYRKIWEMTLFTACPYHKCKLFNNCLDCGLILPLNRNSICKCTCGNDFRDTNPIILPDADLRLASHMMRQLDLLKSQNYALANDNLLVHLSFKEFTDAVYYFVRRVLSFKLKKQTATTKLGYYDNTHEICCEAISIFDEYPNKYIDWLENTIKSNKTFSKTSVKSYFNICHPDTGKKFSERLVPVIYTIFKNVAPSFFEKFSKPYFEYEDDELIDIKQLGQSLNLEPVIIKKLVKGKIILVTKFKKIDNKTVFLFEGDIFMKIMNLVRSNLVNKMPTHKNNDMNLDQIYIYIEKNTNKFCNFLKLILDGKVKPVGEDLNANGLQRFKFRKVDVQKIEQKYLGK